MGPARGEKDSPCQVLGGGHCPSRQLAQTRCRHRGCQYPELLPCHLGTPNPEPTAVPYLLHVLHSEVQGWCGSSPRSPGLLLPPLHLCSLHNGEVAPHLTPPAPAPRATGPLLDPDWGVLGMGVGAGAQGGHGCRGLPTSEGGGELGPRAEGGALGRSRGRAAPQPSAVPPGVVGGHSSGARIGEERLIGREAAKGPEVLARDGGHRVEGLNPQTLARPGAAVASKGRSPRWGDPGAGAFGGWRGRPANASRVRGR